MAPQNFVDYEEVSLHSGGKRCGVQWAPWMGDWFTSWSPRNSNNHSEGPWAHWVDLALKILQDPMTELIRPEARAAVAGLEPRNYYDEWDAEVGETALRERFGHEVP